MGGGGGLIIEICLNPDPASIAAGDITQLDHVPCWKIRKNPFSSRVAHVSTEQTNDSTEPIFAYDETENIEGHVVLWLPPGKSLEHNGIKVQLLGRIDLMIQDGHYEFISLVKELAPPGLLSDIQTTIPFHFRNIEKQYDTYHGCHVFVRYYVRVQVERKFFLPIQKDKEVIIWIRRPEPAAIEPIKMEVGIEDCLHIEFEFNKQNYHLEDVIVGKIDFVLVKIKLKYMEIALIRREISGEGAKNGVIATSNSGGTSKDILTETQTLVRYEVMDGQPVKGESIPVRLFLRGIAGDLTPTYESVYNRFSVQYFLNLVLVDEEDRRYFKQSEIFLWRKVRD